MLYLKLHKIDDQWKVESRNIVHIHGLAADKTSISVHTISPSPLERITCDLLSTTPQTKLELQDNRGSIDSLIDHNADKYIFRVKSNTDNTLEALVIVSREILPIDSRFRYVLMLHLICLILKTNPNYRRLLLKYSQLLKIYERLSSD
ncbi:hypothetical protein GEMRC1_000770 [Eukaryota sp. GEM-RC1]